MKVNSLLPWRQHLDYAHLTVNRLPFLLVGGAIRAARRMAGKLVVTKVRLSYPNLPRAFHGLTITHLTDLHLGPFFTVENHLPHVVAACQELDSDLICCTGDWVDHYLDPLPAGLQKLEKCRPRLGWVGVLGNHDSHDNRWKLIKILRPWLKERLLINQSVRLELDWEIMNILGLDFSMGGLRLQRGLETIRSAPHHTQAPFTLGLAHFPDLFDPFREALHVDLMLSGHTHGGQICWMPPPHPASGPVTHEFKYCRGLYEVKGSHLYVGCGLGQSIPIRINCPPEITQFTLESC